MQNHVGTMMAQSLQTMRSESALQAARAQLSKLNALAWIVSDPKILQSRFWDEKPQNVHTCSPRSQGQCTGNQEAVS